jgi:hypothetical protein
MVAQVATRSWTDLASNVTHLGGVQLADHLDDLVTPGSGPSSLLLGCLHELTHHWCFLSSVGVTITGLTFRIADAIAGEQKHREELVLHDLVAYRTVTALMRPLVEGLALFAEFDINSIGRSRIFSRPLVMGINLFARPGLLIDPLAEDGNFPASEFPGGLNASLSMIGELRPVRLSKDGIRRKVNVLAKRADQDPDGYLIGYLSVKGLWRLLRQRCDRLYTETDLAFAFMRSFFFHDQKLIEILLTPRRERVEELANRIHKHLGRRMGQLADVTAEDIDAFENHVLNETPLESAAWAPCLHISADEWKRGQRAYAKRLRVLLADPVGKSARTGLPGFRDEVRNAFSLMVRRRHIIRLGAQTVQIDVDQDGQYVVRHGDQELLRGHARHAAVQSGDGTIELVFSAASSSGMHRAITVYGPDSLVDIVIPGVKPDDDDLQHELALLGMQHYPSAMFVEYGERIDRLIDSFAAESRLAPELERIQRLAPDVAKNLHLENGFISVPDEHLPEALQLLDDGGVYAFLGYDRDLLEALIIIGVAAPLMPFRALLLRELADHGFADPAAIWRGLVECEARTGLAVVNADDEYRVLVQV